MPPTRPGACRRFAEFIRLSDASKKQEPFFVCVLRPGISPIMVSVPEDWVAFATQQRPVWRHVSINTTTPYLHAIPRNAEKDFTIGNIGLFDGSWLRVGRSASNRDTVLRPFPPRLFRGNDAHRPARIHRRAPSSPIAR